MSIKKPLILIIILSAILIHSLILFEFVSCTPQPKIDKLQKRLDDNYDDFKLIVDYLLDLEYDKCWIDSREGVKLFAELRYHDIQPKDIKSALSRLFNIGCMIVEKSTEHNSISFKLWSNSQHIVCGVLYQIDEAEAPTVQYLTQLDALEQARWYYYISDYNEWRFREYN